MSDEKNQPAAAEPVACTVSVMGAAPDFSKFLKASKAALLLRGVIFLIFGLLMLFKPAAAIASIVIILGVYVLFEGITMLISTFSMPKPARPLMLVNAIMLLILGGVSIFAPMMMGQFAIIFFGVWQLMTGLQCLLLPARRGRAGTVTSGILSIIAGLFFIGAPLFGLLAFAWLFAVLFFVSGLLMLIAGAALR